MRYTKRKSKKVYYLGYVGVFACILDFCVYDFNMQIQIFNVGDFVSVQIPRIDRSSTDSHRLLCVTVDA